MTIDTTDATPGVLRLAGYPAIEVTRLLRAYGVQLIRCSRDASIPGSYWGDEEAGLKGNRLYARPDTPLHSILHEFSHYICMSPTRREQLDTDAGSDNAEENAVCYLQILLADQLPDFGRARMFDDMDAWGYSFRLGSSRAWFKRDADDAFAWLRYHDLVDHHGQPRWRVCAITR